MQVLQGLQVSTNGVGQIIISGPQMNEVRPRGAVLHARKPIMMTDFNSGDDSPKVMVNPGNWPLQRIIHRLGREDAWVIVLLNVGAVVSWLTDSYNQEIYEFTFEEQPTPSAPKKS